MNNEPVAWAREDGVIAFHKQKEVDSQGFKWFPLYTHPAKEHFEDEPQAEELHEILQSHLDLTDEDCQKLEELMGEYWDISYREARKGISLSATANDCLNRFRAILRKAQKKC